MKTQTSFANTDRYVFDFKYCKSSDGYAQLDTKEDAISNLSELDDALEGLDNTIVEYNDEF